MIQEKKYVLGLDVGITSVGWGVIDMESESVVDAGVRLFSEATAENNADRRGFRSARRLLRRRTHRLVRLRHILEEYGVIDESFAHFVKDGITPYELRVKGLREKLSGEELATALLHLAKRRGIDNIAVVVNDKAAKKELGETTDAVNKNDALLRDRFVCEVQLDRLKEGGEVRGIQNRFRTEHYIAEAKQILAHQGLSEDCNNVIIDILKSRRAYYDGPGSKSSPTKYGQWFYDESGELQHVGMIEKMRGKCSVYPEEFRAPKMSYTASLFNLLNQLNNITYNGDQKITPEQKHEIINTFIRKKDGITPLQLAKFLGVSIEEMRGLPVDKKEKPYLINSTTQRNKFAGLKLLRKTLRDNNLSEDLLGDVNVVDNVVQILTDEKSILRRKEKMLKLRHNFLTDEVIEALAKIEGVTGYHSLSLRAMRDMLDDLWNTSHNQMQILAASGIGEHRTDNLVGRRDIPFREDEVYSPVARRAERESIKVINAVRRKYGELDTIVIEMARDKNSKDEKGRIKKEQGRYEAEKKEIEVLLRGKRVSAKTKLKIRLYKQQECKCIYTGAKLDLPTIISDPTAYEIDHIIPLSVSFDDSLANKVLCTNMANQQKGQRTPFAWLSSGGAPRSYDDFKKHVLSLHAIQRKKREYLLFEGDVTKYSTQRQFIQRNLVDTRYATRALLGMVTDYMRANNIETKVHTVRGGVTASFRKRAGIRKSRDEDFSHHAIDALIVASIKKLGYMDQMMDVFLSGKAGEEIAYSRQTGEVITPENEGEYFDQQFLNFVRQLRGALKDRIKYSHKVDRKPNREISNQTIYGVREIDGKEHVIGKYGDIYSDEDGEKIKELFQRGKADKLLMAQHDPVTFALLEKIVKEYQNAKNPFAQYYDEHGPIRKCGRKSGPIIKSLRYDANALGTHLDISHKYPKGHKVIKKSLNPYRIDIYRTPEGLYKFLRLTYSHLRPEGSHYIVVPEAYAREKAERGIGDDAEFQFSLHKNELFGFVKRGEEEKIVRFNGLNYNANKVEYKEIDYHEPRQIVLAVGKSVSSLHKYSTDILGQRYRVRSEDCQFTVGMLS